MTGRYRRSNWISVDAVKAGISWREAVCEDVVRHLLTELEPHPGSCSDLREAIINIVDLCKVWQNL